MGEEYQGRDLNVEPAWLQGLTGEGVVVAIVDDGIIKCLAVIDPNLI